MKENIISTVMLAIMSIVMGIATEWVVPVVFLGCVALYAVVAAIGNMYIDHQSAKARMEDVVVTSYLHNIINNDRTALPASAWFDARYDELPY